MNPLVSIIVPVYNSERYLADCLLSITRQTYRNIEIILLNDGSTDKSLEICNNWAREDKRIKIIDNSNHGVSFTRNLGLQFAQGEFIAFIDSDDQVHATYIEKLVQPLINSNLNLSVCKYYYVNEDDRIIQEKNGKIQIKNLRNSFFEFCLMGGVLYGPWAKMYRKNIIAQHHICFPEDISNGEDQIFNFLYYKYVDDFCFITQSLYFYYKRENGLSKTKTKKSLEDIYKARIALISFLKENKVSHSAGIICEHCITDLADYTCIDNDSFYQYKKIAAKAKKFIDSNYECYGMKKKILFFLLKHSIYFPIYIYYKWKCN